MGGGDAAPPICPHKEEPRHGSVPPSVSSTSLFVQHPARDPGEKRQRLAPLGTLDCPADVGDKDNRDRRNGQDQGQKAIQQVHASSL